VQWQRDFSLADINTELAVLQQMQAANMPDSVIAAQQKRIVGIQFPSLEGDEIERLHGDIDESSSEIG
jgi:hypothetical protein